MWLDYVNQAETEAELKALRKALELAFRLGKRSGSRRPQRDWGSNRRCDPRAVVRNAGEHDDGGYRSG